MEIFGLFGEESNEEPHLVVAKRIDDFLALGPEEPLEFAKSLLDYTNGKGLVFLPGYVDIHGLVLLDELLEVVKTIPSLHKRTRYDFLLTVLVVFLHVVHLVHWEKFRSDRPTWLLFGKQQIIINCFHS